MEHIIYDKLQYEINILRWSRDQGQETIFWHLKIATDVKKDFKYFV